MNKTCLIFSFAAMLALVITEKLHAQVGEIPTGARAAGMAGATITGSDIWTTFNNPGLLASVENLSAGVNYENRFLIRELGISSIAAVYPVNEGAFGLAFSQFGTNLYSQSFLGLAYGRKFGQRFMAGMRLDARQTRLAEDYGQRTTASFALGFGVQLSPELMLAAALFNPLRIKSAKDFDEHLPSVYRAGLSYRIEKHLSLIVEAEKDIRYKPAFRAGLEYNYKDLATARAGIGANPMNHAFGFGFNFGSFLFDIAAIRHEVLGYSPQVSLIWVSR